MRLDDSVQPDDDGSLSVTFRCGSCEWGMTMLINPGETQMVKTLGVKLGGGGDHQPMGMMRAFLTGAHSMPTPSGESSGKCPFTQAVKKAMPD